MKIQILLIVYSLFSFNCFSITENDQNNRVLWLNFYYNLLNPSKKHSHVLAFCFCQILYPKNKHADKWGQKSYSLLTFYLPLLMLPYKLKFKKIIGRACPANYFLLHCWRTLSFICSIWMF